MTNKHKLFFIFLFLLAPVFINLGISQPPPPGGGGPPCWPPPCIPIDGGVSLLFAAGAVYGGKKIYDSFKARD